MHEHFSFIYEYYLHELREIFVYTRGSEEGFAALKTTIPFNFASRANIVFQDKKIKLNSLNLI